MLAPLRETSQRGTVIFFPLVWGSRPAKSGKLCASKSFSAFFQLGFPLTLFPSCASSYPTE